MLKYVFPFELVIGKDQQSSTKAQMGELGTAGTNARLMAVVVSCGSERSFVIVLSGHGCL
jgi:hypothetical protein